MAQRAEPRFLTAIQPPPKAKSTYVHQSFPGWRFHETLGAKLVNSQEELDALDEGWGTVPYPEPAKTVPMDLNTAAGQNAANLQLINRMVEENSKLVERNMILEEKVQEYSPAAEQLKTTKAELENVKKRLADAERRIAESQRMKAEIAANKRLQAKAAQGDKPAEEPTSEPGLDPEPVLANANR